MIENNNINNEFNQNDNVSNSDNVANVQLNSEKKEWKIFAMKLYERKIKKIILWNFFVVFLIVLFFIFNFVIIPKITKTQFDDITFWISLAAILFIYIPILLSITNNTRECNKHINDIKSKNKSTFIFLSTFFWIPIIGLIFSFIAKKKMANNIEKRCKKFNASFKEIEKIERKIYMKEKANKE